MKIDRRPAIPAQTLRMCQKMRWTSLKAYLLRAYRQTRGHRHDLVCLVSICIMGLGWESKFILTCVRAPEGRWKMGYYRPSTCLVALTMGESLQRMPAPADVGKQMFKLVKTRSPKPDQEGPMGSTLRSRRPHANPGMA